MPHRDLALKNGGSITRGFGGYAGKLLGQCVAASPILVHHAADDAVLSERLFLSLDALVFLLAGKQLFIQQQ